jgi:uncharacterized membrane protein
MDEGKKVIISFLRVTGILLIGFPIFVYFGNQKGLSPILPFVAISMLIGAIFLAVSTIIWWKNRGNLGEQK